jgi:hypothetical protein
VTGAGETGGGGCALAEFCLEQLAGVLARAVETSGAAATAGAGVGGTALAERIIAEELQRERWQEADLKSRPKGDSVKVVLAARWREETTMTVGWLAERLAMGTRGSLNPLLDRRGSWAGSILYQELTPLWATISFDGSAF